MSAQKKVLLTLSANQQTLVTPPLDLPADNEEEEDEGGIDIVLTQIQEEMMLQNLLHKRMLRHDRALTFEHKSRHKLWVILPPDIVPAKLCFDEGTCWIKQMAHNTAHLEGMLLCLSQTQPAIHVSVDKKIKVRISLEVLSASQILVPGQLNGVNDTSYLARIC